MNDFLKSIKDDIGEQKFNELMLADGGATLIFAVDTTGSMADEIAAARGIANAIINMPRNSPLITFFPLSMIQVNVTHIILCKPQHL